MIEKWIVGGATVVLITISLCVAACDYSSRQVELKMVAAGATPLEVRCYWVSSGTMDPICVAFVAGGGGKEARSVGK